MTSLVNLAFRVSSLAEAEALIDSTEGWEKTAVHDLNGNLFLEARFGGTRINFFCSAAYDHPALAQSPGFLHASYAVSDLDQILADSPADCSASFDAGQGGDATQAGDTNGKALGFRLTLLGQDGQALKVLHEDKAVPASRNCPTSYSLSEVYEFKPDGKPTAVAVVVQRFSQGYEGPDRRFMAVTGQLP